MTVILSMIYDVLQPILNIYFHFSTVEALGVCDAPLVWSYPRHWRLWPSYH